MINKWDPMWNFMHDHEALNESQRAELSKLMKQAGFKKLRFSKGFIQIHPEHGPRSLIAHSIKDVFKKLKIEIVKRRKDEILDELLQKLQDSQYTDHGHDLVMELREIRWDEKEPERKRAAAEERLLISRSRYRHFDPVDRNFCGGWAGNGGSK